jgi:hypothetical protein
VGGPRQQRKPLSQQITELMQQEEARSSPTLRPCVQCWEYAIHEECRAANVAAYKQRKGLPK